MTTTCRVLCSTVLTVSLAGGAALLLSGCAAYSPGGSGKTDDTFTYWSTTDSPKTVTLIDTRTGQAMWTSEVPVGKELVVRFVPNVNKDKTPAYPDVMRYDLLPLGKESGNLASEMPVPSRDARRLDWVMRTPGEAAPGVTVATQTTKPDPNAVPRPLAPKGGDAMPTPAAPTTKPSDVPLIRPAGAPAAKGDAPAKPAEPAPIRPAGAPAPKPKPAEAPKPAEKPAGEKPASDKGGR